MYIHNQFYRMMKQAGYLAVLMLLVAAVLFAQSNTGTITGVVQDANGGVVPNATVTVTNTGTNETKTVTTDSDGRYEAPSLSVGLYKVTATAGGFQETTVENARLAVGDKLRVDVVMAV